MRQVYVGLSASHMSQLAEQLMCICMSSAGSKTSPEKQPESHLKSSETCDKPGHHDIMVMPA